MYSSKHACKLVPRMEKANKLNSCRTAVDLDMTDESVPLEYGRCSLEFVRSAATNRQRLEHAQDVTYAAFVPVDARP